MPSVFIPFLKRYLYVEKGWMGKLDKPQSLATFTRTNPPGSFTLALFNHAECDQTQLEKRLAKAWNDAGKPVEGKVSFVGVTGATGIAFIWNEPGPNGTVRNYCMIPEGKVFTARISVLASDTATRRFIERQILQQIFRADRKFQGR